MSGAIRYQITNVEAMAVQRIGGKERRNLTADQIAKVVALLDAGDELGAQRLMVAVLDERSA